MAPLSGSERPLASIVVVDDFLSDPDEVRAFAIRAEYVPAWGSWDGFHTMARHPNTKDELYAMASLVSGNEPNWAEIDASYQFWHKASAGGFALMLGGAAGVLHAHRRSGEWAGVVYLSTPQDCSGRKGTIFFRHRDTGLEQVSGVDPPLAEEKRALDDGGVSSAWAELEASEMKYNRLILFDSRRFHAASSGFGTDASNGRLIQVFNFSFPTSP